MIKKDNVPNSDHLDVDIDKNYGVQSSLIEYIKKHIEIRHHIRNKETEICIH